MALTRWERVGGLLLVAGLLLLVGLRPLLRVVVREVAPDVAVCVHELRHEPDPWGRPFVVPGITKDPTSGVTTRWTGPLYSTGPDGVDDTGALRAPAELWFADSRYGQPYPTLSVHRSEPVPPQPFDDRHGDQPAPAWDDRFRPLMAGDDVHVARGTTWVVRLLVGPLEVQLAVACLSLGWLLLLPAAPLGAPLRPGRQLLRRLGLVGPPVALFGWLGSLLAREAWVTRLAGSHPLVPAQVAVGGSFALVALLAVVGLRLWLAAHGQAEAGERAEATSSPSPGCSDRSAIGPRSGR